MKAWACAVVAKLPIRFLDELLFRARMNKLDIPPEAAGGCIGVIGAEGGVVS